MCFFRSNVSILFSSRSIYGLASSEFPECGSDRYTNRADRREQAANQADDDCGDEALPNQVSGNGKIEHDLAETRGIQGRNGETVEEQPRKAATNDAANDGQGRRFDDDRNED